MHYYLIEPGYEPITSRIRVFRTKESRAQCVERKRRFYLYHCGVDHAIWWMNERVEIDGFFLLMWYRFHNGGWAFVIIAIVIMFAMGLTW